MALGNIVAQEDRQTFFCSLQEENKPDLLSLLVGITDSISGPGLLAETLSRVLSKTEIEQRVIV